MFGGDDSFLNSMEAEPTPAGARAICLDSSLLRLRAAVCLVSSQASACRALPVGRAALVPAAAVVAWVAAAAVPVAVPLAATPLWLP
jgi:hypothetical protein